MQKMYALIHIRLRKRLGECAIQGEVLIPKDSGNKQCVCDRKWAEINLKLCFIAYCIVGARDKKALFHTGGRHNFVCECVYTYDLLPTYMQKSCTVLDHY